MAGAEYDVFVSFHGEDVRNNFVSHLRKAFKHKGITTFLDEDLKRGNQISPALVEAIERSSIYVVVFSKNYASSKWCLDEVLKIVECSNKYGGRKVLPVFYHVDPSNVRNQKKSYEEAFNQHRKHDHQLLQRWRNALTQIANLSGLHSANWSESEMIDKITQEIFKILDRLTLNDVNGLVGIEDRVDRIESYLHAIDVDDDVRILGIWGMGGIGKTTVAKILFHKLKNKFDGYCFLENVRENSGKNGHKLPKLRKKLLSQVMLEENLPMDISLGFLQNSIRGRKVLIILDDIDDIEQLENLVGERHWFGVGSRIIITTRNRQLLTNKVDKVYDYAQEQLSDEEALLLFSRHVFKTSQPPKNFLELSRKATNYASGIPLAVKLLGSHLCKKDEQTWISALSRLEKKSNKKMFERILGVSFEGLEPHEKDTLLDVACFFKGDDVEYASSIWDACGFFPLDAISVLSDKCLISLRDGFELCMHDLIQEMCKEKAREENVEPGERSRLWEVEDIFRVFNKNTGTSKIQSIILDLSETNEVLELRKDAFENMEKLRLLKFFSIDLDEISTKIKLPRGLTMLPDSLRCLFWDRYPNAFLPSKFDAQNVVEVSLRQSCIKQLKKEPKMFKHSSLCLKNVKSLNLSGCMALSNLPTDIGNMVHLYKLSLKESGISSLPSSIGNLTKLIELKLSKCKKLVSLPESISNLKLLQELPLKGSGVSNLPSSIGNLTGLIKLNLSNCKKLVSLPDSICNLKLLQTLNLNDCESLQHLPQNIGNLESLFCFSAEGSSIKRVPFSVVYLKNVRVLSFKRCRGIKGESTTRPSCMSVQLLPLEVVERGDSYAPKLFMGNCNFVEPPSFVHYFTTLTCLDLSGNNFDTLPQTIFNNFCHLSTLVLSDCRRLRSLPDLPSSLKELAALRCTSLESITSIETLLRGFFVGGVSKRTSQQRFYFHECSNIKNQIDNIMKSLVQWLRLLEKEARSLYDGGRHVHITLLYPGNEIPKWFSNEANNTVTLQIPPHCIGSFELSFTFALSPYESISFMRKHMT